MKKLVFYVLFLFQLSLWGSGSVQETSAYWDGGYFYPCERGFAPVQSHIIDEPTFYFHPFVTCYGHAMLDGLVPLYAMLKERDLLNTPINLVLKLNSSELSNQTFTNILQFIKDVFHFKQVIILNTDSKRKMTYFFKRLIVHDHLPVEGHLYYDSPSFYRVFPDVYISMLKEFGIQDNIVFQDAKTNANIVKEFVDFVKSSYNIKMPMIKNRILIPARACSRKIVNQAALVNHLRASGYEVVVIDFEKMSVRQQIIETAQAEYLMGTYGSNLVNAIFLNPEANVVILWHKYAKYFWSRKYCIIHSAFLSTGVRLIEYDQPNYDDRNIYKEPIHVHDYFYRVDNKNILRPEKATMEELVKYPLSAMSEFTNVDLYIEPTDIVNLLKKAAFLQNQPCQF